jgi:hypothetical protein
VAKVLYPKFKEAMLSHNPSIDFDADTLKVPLVSTSDYSYSAAHQFKSSVPSYAGTTNQTLGSITLTDGVFDAANVTFTAVSVDGSKAVNTLTPFKDTGVAGTSPLICHIDGFSLLPNGGDITIAFDDGANKIFAL